MVTKDDVLNALKTVKDGSKDVVSNDLIQGLVVKDGHVGFSLEVDPREGTAKEPIRKACEDAVYKVKGVLSVTAVLTAHSSAPGEPSAPSETTGRPKSMPESARPSPMGDGPPPPGPPGIAKVDKIIAVASGKGGVGKSTVAVNLALGLAALGKRVGILDADIYGPSVPRMLGLTGQPESDGAKLKPMEAWGLKAMSIGLLVSEDRAMIWRGPMVMSALTQMMNDVDWGELDVLVVDMPPGTGDAQLTMAQRVPLKGAVIVSTPQEIALADTRKGITMFERTRVPILGIIENMAYFVSPESGEKTFIFGEGGARRTAEKFGCDFLGEVPIDVRLRETSDEGTPLTASEPASDSAKLFSEIAARVAKHLDADEARTPPKIVVS